MRNIKKKNENSLINHFIRILKKESLEKKINKKRLSLVLTGGSSPKNLYRKLGECKIDWSNIDLFWGDERFVSRRSKNSNFRLAHDLFLKKNKIPKKNIFPIQTDKININNSALRYKKNIKKYFQNKKINFDIFLLGMGNDGHVVSIFPNSRELKQNFISKSVYRKDFKRITLGLNIINNSKKIFLWLSNKEKTQIYKKYAYQGKSIPVNNLNKKKLYCFSIN